MRASSHDSDPREGDFDTLLSIIARLRGPQGCPWDRQQTHLSLRESLLQECYEVLQALDEADTQELCQELGDLLMHIVLQAQIAAEAGEFDITDVIRSICTKLIHRHPHVFGQVKLATPEEVLNRWESLKREEGTSLLSGVPGTLPALSCSQEIQHRVARVGFDWVEVEGIIDKLAEEVREVGTAPTQQQKEEEMGDLLFTLANIGRHWNIDLESALRGANEKFRRRFAYMEEVCRQRGINISDLSFAEQNALWEKAKQK